jgi:hypothetical protein
MKQTYEEKALGLQARETIFQKGEPSEKTGEKLHISAQSLHNRFMVNL